MLLVSNTDRRPQLPQPDSFATEINFDPPFTMLTLPMKLFQSSRFIHWRFFVKDLKVTHENYSLKRLQPDLVNIWSFPTD